MSAIAAARYLEFMTAVPHPPRISPEPEDASASASETPEVNILDHLEVPSAWSTFHRIRYRVRRPGGEWIDQEREFLDRGDAVALLPYCPATGNILLTRQFRMPSFLKHPGDGVLLEVCGGILDEKDPAAAARREAAEELGLALDTVEPAFEAYSTPGSVCEKVYSFLAAYSPEQRRFQGGGLRQEGEEIEIVEMPLCEALHLLRTGGIRDARTVSLLLYLAVDGRCPL